MDTWVELSMDGAQRGSLRLTKSFIVGVIR